MICEACRKVKATDRHHKYSQTKVNRKNYGDLIDDSRNIQWLCRGCHISEASGITQWSEQEFTTALRIKPRSIEGMCIENRQTKKT